MPNQTELFLMLFADDLSLLSSVVRGLQNQLNLLYVLGVFMKTWSEGQYRQDQNNGVSQRRPSVVKRKLVFGRICFEIDGKYQLFDNAKLQYRYRGFVSRTKKRTIEILKTLYELMDATNVKCFSSCLTPR